MKGKSASPTSAQQYLSFSLNPNRQALLSAHQLAEIVRLDPAQIVPISEMPAAVIGAYPWQGEVLWLVDLAYLFGYEPLLKPSNLHGQSNTSTIKARSRRGDLALWVAQVGELISCEPSSIGTPELALPQRQNPENSPDAKGPGDTVQLRWIQASWAHPDGSIWPVLDLEAIVGYLLEE